MNFNIHKICLLAFVIVNGLSSCQKDESLFSKQAVLEKKEGDNDEPFIWGTITQEGQPLHPAKVVLMKQGGTLSLDSVETDSTGTYDVATAEEGFFFLRIYQNDILLYTTEVVEVTDSTLLPIVL